MSARKNNTILHSFFLYKDDGDLARPALGKGSVSGSAAAMSALVAGLAEGRLLSPPCFSPEKMSSIDSFQTTSLANFNTRTSNVPSHISPRKAGGDFRVQWNIVYPTCPNQYKNAVMYFSLVAEAYAIWAPVLCRCWTEGAPPHPLFGVDVRFRFILAIIMMIILGNNNITNSNSDNLDPHGE